MTETASDVTEKTGEAAKRRVVLTAKVLGSDVQAAQSVKEDEDDVLRGAFAGKNVVEPTFDPLLLYRIWENSSSLNQNIQAYVTNIEGLGYRLEPVLDFDSDEGFEQVREAMWMERIRRERRLGNDPDSKALLPEDDEVEEKVEELKRQSRLERIRLESFLEAASSEGSFTKLRREKRHNQEMTGNAYWEVLRNRQGDVARFVNVPPTHVRCTTLDNEPTEVEDRVPFGAIGWDVVTHQRFFRRYLQVVGRKVVWFKEFGDPRIVSRSTGKVYADEDDWAANAPPGDEMATELIHFRIHAPGQSYGVPRWIGNLLSVLGSRAADEVNFSYFDNKAIPPLALLVSGGSLSDDSISRIENHIKDQIKGREGFHKILVVEAVSEEADLEPGEKGLQPTVKFEKLADQQQGDALFQKYDERNTDKIGSSFRLPRLLRGDARDFNRATANASLRFADEQVFQPERSEFDSWFSRVILTSLNIRLWRFKSLGPQTRDVEMIVDALERAAKAGFVAPNEGREILSQVLGRDLPPFDVSFMRQPLPFTLAGFSVEREQEITDAEHGKGNGESRLSALFDEARRLAAADGTLDERETDAAQRAMDDAAEAVQDGTGEDDLAAE